MKIKMKKILFFYLISVIPHFLLAQNAIIQVNALSNHQKVSPYIYGRNSEFSDNPASPTSAATFNLYRDAGVTFGRQNAGNNCTKYNWRKKLTSHPDWYNNVYSHDWDYAAKTILTNIPSMQVMFGFQLIGWAAANTTNNFNDWGYNHSTYWSGVTQNLAGGGTPNPAGGSNALVEGDPARYLMKWPADSTTAILDHWFGTGGLYLKKDNLAYWNMDNEIEIWHGTHNDVMPVQVKADSFMIQYFKVAKLARAKFPGIKLVAPATANEWQWYKYAEEVLNIDGKYYPWLEYFIKRVADEQKATGIKLLDVVDIHAYLGDSNPSDVVQLYRVFFDKEYNYPGANGLFTSTGGWDTSIKKEYILQRIRDWLNQYMGPDNGVGVAVSESGFNGSNPNLTSVLYASILGTFASQGVEFYTPWSWNTGQWEVLHLFSRYAKSTSISTTSTLDTYVSGYSTVTKAADSITVFLVNRDVSAAHTATLNISDFEVADGTYQTLQIANLPGTETFKSHTQNALKTGTVNLQSNSLSLSLPQLSVTAILLCSKSIRNAIDSYTSGPKFQFTINQNSLSDEVYIHYTASTPSKVSFALYTLEGKLVKSQNLEQSQDGSIRIGTEELRNGCYIVRMKSGLQSSAKKFIILR
jgi:hypothetical protein